MSDSEDRQPRDPTQNEEEEPGFKVTDRRLFDREGNLREEVSEAREDEEEPGAEKAKAGPSGATGSGAIVEPSTADVGSGGPAAADSPDVKTPPSASAGPEAPGGPEAAAGPAEPEAPTPGRGVGGGERPSPEDLPRDFSSFIEGQFFEGMLYLGAIRHPQTGEVVEDLEMAKYKIDVLEMLQDKTEGNLSSEEKSKLEDILYQLRMVYVQKGKESSS